MSFPITILDLLGTNQTVFDVEGRPLNELRAPEAQRRGVPFVIKTCPYVGTRKGKMMNVSALRQAHAHHVDWLELISRLRQEYFRRRGERRTTLEDVQRIGNVLCHLPEYLVHRAANPVPRDELPPVVAVAYKAMVGMRLAASRCFIYLLRYADERWAEPIPDEALLIDFAEQNGLLIDPGNGNACAGPQAMIAESFRVAQFGSAASTSGGDAIESLRLDTDAALQYGDLHFQIFLIRTITAALALPRLQVIQRLGPTREPAYRPTQPRHAGRAEALARVNLDTAFAACAAMTASSRLPSFEFWNQIPEVSQRLEALRDELHRAAHAQASVLGAGWEGAVDATLSLLAIERCALRALADVQARLNDVLGRDREAGPVPRSFLESDTGGFLLELAGLGIHVSVEETARGAHVRAGHVEVAV